MGAELDTWAGGVTAVDGRLRQLVAAFLLGFSSENTRRNYGVDLRTWFAFCADHDVDPLRAQRAHLDAWARASESLGKAPRTLARGLSTVSSFYTYLVSEGMVATSPAEHVKRPEIDADDSPAVGLDREQGQALLRGRHKCTGASETPHSSRCC